MSSMKQIVQKLNKFKDLKDAIRFIKTNDGDIKKQEQADVFQQTLKHLGLTEASPGIFHHLIGTDDPEAHRYMCAYDLNKKNQGIPHINVDMLMKDGSVIAKCPHMYDDLNKAMKGIVSHYFNKTWGT